MEKLHFNVLIDAPRERVWEVLWGDKSYDDWTSAFAEGSTVETDWNKGSKVLFTDGKGSGMVSFIEDKKPNEFMSFKHMGMLKDGVEDFDSPTTKAWAGSMENYTLKNVNGKTELQIDIDVTGDFKDYMEKAWPKALDKLKNLSESKN